MEKARSYLEIMSSLSNIHGKIAKVLAQSRQGAKNKAILALRLGGFARDF
jgi:hypothetical protein